MLRKLTRLRKNRNVFYTVQSEVYREQCWLYSLTAAGRIPLIHLLHTLRVNQSAEGAAQCCDSVLQELGLHHASLSHHLDWVKRASQDGAGLLDKFIKSPPVFCCSCRLIHRKWLMPPQYHTK